MWSKGNPLIRCLWECKLMQPLWKTVWRFLKKLKIELPYDPAILLLGIYLKKNPKSLIWEDTCTPVFMAALFTIVKIWKQPKCPSTDEWMKKMWFMYIYAYTQNGILLRHKKVRNFAICSNMDGLGRHYAKWNKSEKEKYCMISFICGI